MASFCPICGNKISVFSNQTSKYCNECIVDYDIVKKNVHSYLAIFQDTTALSKTIQTFKQKLNNPSCDPNERKKLIEEIDRINNGFDTFEEFQLSVASYFPAQTSHVIADIFVSNNEMKKFAIIDEKKYYRSPRDFSDLIDFSVKEDGNSITSGRAGAATVGALLAGTAGAVIGGSMSRKTEQMINSLEIVLSYDGLDAPIDVITLINMSVSKSSNTYKEKVMVCNQIISVLKQIMTSNEGQKNEKQKDESAAKPERGARAIYAFSVADES